MAVSWKRTLDDHEVVLIDLHVASGLRQSDPGFLRTLFQRDEVSHGNLIVTGSAPTVLDSADLPGNSEAVVQALERSFD